MQHAQKASDQTPMESTLALTAYKWTFIVITAHLLVDVSPPFTLSIKTKYMISLSLSLSEFLSTELYPNNFYYNYYYYDYNYCTSNTNKDFKKTYNGDQ